MKKIEVIISPEGEVTIEAIGYKGSACERATAELEKALGTTTERKKKPEYHSHASATQKVGGS